jgi:hypothetical protein
VQDNSQLKAQRRGGQVTVYAIVVDFEESNGTHTLVTDNGVVYRWAMVTRSYWIVQRSHQVSRAEFERAAHRVSGSTKSKKPPVSDELVGDTGACLVSKKPKIWEWHDGQAWCSYPPHVQAQLNAAQGKLSIAKGTVSTDTLEPKKIKLKIAGRAYIVCFTSMTQINVETGFSRQIRVRNSHTMEANDDSGGVMDSDLRSKTSPGSSFLFRDREGLSAGSGAGSGAGSRLRGPASTSIEERIRALAEQGLSRSEIVQALRSGLSRMGLGMSGEDNSRDECEGDSEDDEHGVVLDSMFGFSSSGIGIAPPLRRQFSALDMSQVAFLIQFIH